MHLGCVYTNYTYLGGPVAHCTPGVRLRDRSQKFTTPWTAIFSERHFRTPAVRICTVPRSSTRTVHLGCVYTNYTYLGGPVAHCTPGVRLRDRTRQFSTPYTVICSERHFRTPAVRICTVPPSRTRTVHLGCVYTNYTYLGGPVAHCTPGVRLRDRTRLFSTPCTAICSERYFCTPAVRICTVPQSRTRTVHLGCVYTNYTYLGGPVAHCTPGVRLRDRTRQFSTPYTAICSERYFRTPAVRICTVPRSRTRTVHLGCVYTNYTYLGGPVAHCYTRCTTPRPHTAVQHTVHSNLQLTAFSYTCCTDLYSSPK